MNINKFFKSTQKRIQNPIVYHYETGQNLPVAQMEQPIREIAKRPVPNYDDSDFETLVQIVLFKTWPMVVNDFQILGGCGRIAKVAFTPLSIMYDPILPLSLVELGHEFTKQYRVIADMVSDWIGRYERTGGSYQGYGETVTYYAQKTIAAAYNANLLTLDELRYFEFNLWKYVSNPALVYDELGLQPSFHTSWRSKYQFNMTSAEFAAAKKAGAI